MAINPKIRDENSDNGRRRRRQAVRTDNSAGKRILELLGDRDYGWISGVTGIPASTLSDYVQKGISRADNAVKIARALGTTVEYLMEGTGAGARPSPLWDATQADWVMVPEYDLRQIDDMGKGEVLASTPFRRDWLNRAFGASDLWLARLPSDYPPLVLAEGEQVLLRDAGVEELGERHLYIWRVHGHLVIGRFSAVMRPTEPNGEYWVAPTMIGNREEDMRPVARIMGRPLASIR